MNNYWKIRKNAQKFYKKLKSVKCPALDNKEITFPSSGFHHLIFKGRKTRPKKEQIVRLKYIEHAYEIISKSTMYQEYDLRQAKYFIREKGVKKEVNIETEYWGIVAIYKGRRIKVIIKKSGKGNLQFWSVIPDWKVGIRDGNKIRKLYKGDLKRD